MGRCFLYSLLTVCLLTACAEEEQNPLPYVRVDFSVSITGYLLTGLPVKVQKGYYGYNRNGVIIVPQGFSNDEYQAFDATCVRNIKEDIASINVDEGGFTATCPKCGTVYNLFSGYAQNQSFCLQRYRAYASNGRVYVTN